jgi:hypothetical protein
MVTLKKKTRKKVKNRLLLVAAASSALAVLYALSVMQSQQKIEIIYFRNQNCGLIGNSDEIISEAVQNFGSSIDVRTINAQLYSTEPNDTEEIMSLRERYNVIGLPDIIINGKKFTSDFTRSDLFAEICNNFVLKPEACK